MHRNFENYSADFDSSRLHIAFDYYWFFEHFYWTTGGRYICIAISNVVSHTFILASVINDLYLSCIRSPDRTGLPNNRFIFIWWFFFSSRFPFDTRNPIGYCVGCVFEYLTIVNQAFVVMCIFCFCLETVLLLISLANDIECALNTLNRYIISYKKERKKINKKVSQLIQFHVHAKQLSRVFVLKFQSIKTKMRMESLTFLLITIPHFQIERRSCETNWISLFDLVHMEPKSIIHVIVFSTSWVYLWMFNVNQLF